MKRKITSFTASEAELEVIDALCDELKVSRSKLLVMGAYFLESLYFKAKRTADPSKVIELQEIITRRDRQDKLKQRRAIR